MLEEVAVRVFRAWRLGQADRDDGVLFLVSRDDRELRIEVGYGLEGDLTDARSSEIIRNVVVPRFRDGDFEAGILAGTEAILGSVDGTYVSARSRSVPPPRGLGVVLLAIPTVLLALFLRLSRGGGGVGVYGALGFALGVVASVGVSLWTLSFWVFALVPVYVIVPVRVYNWLEQHPVYGPQRRIRRRLHSIRVARSQRHTRLILDAQNRGETHVVIDGVNRSVPSVSDSIGSGAGGGWSSSAGGSRFRGSSRSSFRGDGGSSGGGGASGRW